MKQVAWDVTAWFFPLVMMILLVTVITRNIGSGGLGLNFDDLSYIGIFRDIVNGKFAISPYTTPKVLPVLVLGSLYYLTRSLGFIALLQGVVGALLLVELYKLGKSLGLTEFLAACASSIFLAFHLRDIANGNACVWATWFMLFATNRYFRKDLKADFLGAFFFLCACLTRPEPAIFLTIWGTVILIKGRMSREKVLSISLGYLLTPVIIAGLLSLVFDKVVFGSWLYSGEQVRNFARVQTMGAWIFPEFNIWDLPPSWKQLAGSLDAGPLMNSGLFLKSASIFLIIAALFKVEKSEKSKYRNILILLLTASSILSVFVYKVVGLVIYPRFFLLFSIALCLTICFGIQSIWERTSRNEESGGKSWNWGKVVLVLFVLAVVTNATATSYLSLKANLRDEAKTREYIKLFEKVDKRGQERPYRVVSSAQASLASLLLNRPVSNFIPFGWIPMLVNRNKAIDDKCMNISAVRQSILCELNGIECFIFGNERPPLTTLPTLLDLSDYSVLTNANGYQVWINRKSFFSSR